MRPGEIATEALSGLVVGLAIAAALAWATNGREGQERREGTFRPFPPFRPVQPFPRFRVALLGALYVVLFLTAGSIIFPFVQSFYATSALLSVPSFGIVVLTEFTRGIIHATAVIPLLQTMTGRRPQAAILSGSALSILGGVAALFLPVDDVFPFEIRRITWWRFWGATLCLA
jgi:hypothetical protein